MTSDPITRLNAALEGRYRVEREIGELIERHGHKTPAEVREVQETGTGSS